MSAQLITGVILAGGRASRWGGQDKGLIEVAGRPMIEYVLECVRPQVSHLLISANRNLDTYQAYGVPVIPDGDEEFRGPLAGISAALRNAQTDWLAVVPCDAPLLPADWVARLLGAARDPGTARIAVAHDGERLQSMVALLHCDLREDLDEYLASGERKVDRWYARHDMQLVSFSDCAESFVNINRPEDRARVEALLTGGEK